MIILFRLTALPETGTGLSPVAVTTTIIHTLSGMMPDTHVALTVARIAVIALIAPGMTCRL